MLLVIEVADSSRAKDLKKKSALYRVHGVREYWLIDLETRSTHRHSLDGTWPEAGTPFETAIAPRFAPELTLRISESGL